MAPHVKDSKQFVSQTETKHLHAELLEKLRLEEEKEKKKLEREAKKRAEVEKMKQENLLIQASFIVPKKKSRSKNNQKKKVPSSSLDASKVRSSSLSQQPAYSSRNKGNAYESCRRRSDSSSSYDNYPRSVASEGAWDGGRRHFPAMATEAPLPRVNVWAERQSRVDAIKVLEPQNEMDEEAMLKVALELSRAEAKEEERRRKLAEEYQLQTEALKMTPEFEESSLGPFCELENESPLSFQSVKEDWHTSENESPLSFQSAQEDWGWRENDSARGNAGARPKISKAIDKITSCWGAAKSKKVRSGKLPDFVADITEEHREASTKEVSRSEKLSTFVNDVTEDNDSSADHYESTFDNTDTREVYKTLQNSINLNDSLDGWHSFQPEKVENSVQASGRCAGTGLYGGKENYLDDCALKKRIAFEEGVVGAEELERQTTELKFSKKMSNRDEDLQSFKIETDSLSNIEIEKQKSGVNEIDNVYGYDCKGASEDFLSSSEHETRKFPVSDPWEKRSANIPFTHSDHSSLSNPWAEKSAEGAATSDSSTCMDKPVSYANPLLSDNLKIDLNQGFKLAGNCEVNKILSASSNQSEFHSISPSDISNRSNLENDSNFMLCDNLSNELKEQFKFAGNHEVDAMVSDSVNQSEFHSVLPHPSSSGVSDLSHLGNNVITDENVTLNEFQNVHPQLIPPHFPVMNSLFPSPAVVPGMMGNSFMMDPGAMRQMLMRQMMMINIPYFAHELLAVEQYYKYCMAMNAPPFLPPNVHPTYMSSLDVQFQNQLSADPCRSSPPFPPQAPSAAAPLSPPNTMSAPQFQEPFSTQTLPDLSAAAAPLSPPNTMCAPRPQLSTENAVGHSTAHCMPPPGLGNSMACTGAAPLGEGAGATLGEDWFKSYFSEDLSAIPPPKPPTSSGSVPISAPTPLVKQPSSGRGDMEDEDSRLCSDDGWDEYSLATRPVKYSEARKNPVYRQPSSKPQVSRFQQSKNV